MESLRTDFIVTVPPSSEPVALSDLRSPTTGSWLRVDYTDDDSVIAALITECRMLAEQITGKALASQTIQVQYTLPQVNAGALSGLSLIYDQDYYQFNESLGANPFQPAPYALEIPMPPLVAVSLFEYRATAFNAWQTWPATVGSFNNYVIDTLATPGWVYLQAPPAAYQYRLTCTVGTNPIPADLKLALIQLIAWKYENRLGEDLPEEIKVRLMARKTWVL